jgi:hypothetical protein
MEDMGDKGANMIRKLLMVAAAAAVPMGAMAVAGVASEGVSGAATVVALTPTQCVMSGTVTFAPPGISLVGITTTSKTSSTTSTVAFSGCGTGTLSGGGTLNIPTKNSKCLLPVTSSEPSTCAKGLDITDSGGGLGSPGTFKSLGKAVKSLPLTLNEGTPVLLKQKALSESEIVGGTCGAEVGFLINTSIKTSPKSTGITGATLNVCLGQDSNSKNFFTDLTGGGTIASTQIDPATSFIKFHA